MKHLSSSLRLRPVPLRPDLCSLAALLSRDLRTRPSGPGGTFTRRDHLAGAVRSLVAGMLAMGVAGVAAGFDDPRHPNAVWQLMMFGSGILAMVAAAMLLIALARAAVGWKGKPVAVVETPHPDRAAFPPGS